MYLYHGSNIIIDTPKILVPNRRLDFGAGFYVTTDYEQAKKWALTVKKRLNSENAFVSIFNIDDEIKLKYQIKEFISANKEWLEFVCSHRKATYDINDKYDIIIGPVANDTTIEVLSLYMEGFYDENEAIRRLLTQKLSDQWVFKNDNVIKKLVFMKGDRVD